MTRVTYRIVEHDGGWAYKLGDTYSETFGSHQAAHGAAQRAAREQRVPDADAMIEWEDGEGRWIVERADGHDRPEVDIED